MISVSRGDKPAQPVLAFMLHRPFNWKFLEARHCTVGGVDCIAIRISYTGELGWELYPNMENMEKMYRDILDKGAEFDIGHIGTRCINTARIEKGIARSVTKSD